MKLIFHLPEGKVEEFSVNKTVVTVGRGNICDVVLPFEGFSRKHAQIELVDGEIFVTDLGSTNGVYIDGQRIPAAERTQMQSFLNLQIGPAQQVEVLEDQVSPAAMNFPHAEPRPQRKKSEAQEHTRTTQMDPKLLRKSPARRGKEKPKGQSKLTMFMAPLLILAGAVYYFVSQDKEAVVDSGPKETTEAAKVPLTETKFLSNAMISSSFNSKSCAQDKAEWCKEAGILESNQEGAVIEGRSLIIYMNMTPFKDEKYHDTFNALDEQQRLEIFTIRRIFSTALVRKFSKQTALDNLQVAAGWMVHGEYKLRLALKINRDIDMKKAEKYFVFDVFDRILNQGNIQDLSEISSLYEKLPLD